MPPDARRRRRWLPILAGVGILLAFIVVGVIFVVAAFVRDRVDIETTSDTVATSEFDRVKSQFPGRTPLLELTPGGRPRYTEPRTIQPPATGHLETLHVLAWDPDERKLARFSLPFWLLRMKSTPIELGAYASGLDDEGVQLRPEDIEKYGPGIVLDHTTTSGERVLFWAQ